jgi:hypothetical protein
MHDRTAARETMRAAILARHMLDCSARSAAVAAAIRFFLQLPRTGLSAGASERNWFFEAVPAPKGTASLPLLG